MKIIISHDVDHLYWNDHLTDLFYPKLWVRETLAFLRRRISAKEWVRRMCMPFHRNLHRLEEVMRFDKDNGIPSTFFIGMAKGLGMSYSREKALSAIRKVQSEGFETGVHGIAYENAEAIQMEYAVYQKLTGCAPSGIRMHYVRYTGDTFSYLEQAGYLYDSTEFDKQSGGTTKAPYRVGNMWEFPLAIMDTYLPYDEQKAKQFTLDVLNRAEAMNIGYCTVLFHDINFSDAFRVYMNWYKWFVGYCKERGMRFASFSEAVWELETRGRRGQV